MWDGGRNYFGLLNRLGKMRGKGKFEVVYWSRLDMDLLEIVDLGWLAKVTCFSMVLLELRLPNLWLFLHFVSLKNQFSILHNMFRNKLCFCRLTIKLSLDYTLVQLLNKTLWFCILDEICRYVLIIIQIRVVWSFDSLFWRWSFDWLFLFWMAFSQFSDGFEHFFTGIW